MAFINPEKLFLKILLLYRIAMIPISIRTNIILPQLTKILFNGCNNYIQQLLNFTNNVVKINVETLHEMNEYVLTIIRKHNFSLPS